MERLDKKMIIKKFILVWLFLIINLISAENNLKTDLIVFSFDRPLQLYAFLESTEKYITGLDLINVIYRVSSPEIEIAYQIVKDKFINVHFIKENYDFKSLVLNLIFESSNDNIIFGVDDIIVKDYVNITECISNMEKNNVYGFYLRLGKNITQCYMHNDEITPVPQSKKITDSIYQWNFNDGTGDWKYPNTVDMTIYKKSEIKAILSIIDFKNPSDLESAWANKANYNLTGLYFDSSKIINTPLNIVHDEKLNQENRHSAIYTTKDLLDIFNAGLKININVYSKINNIAPHAAIIPAFIKR